MFEKISLRNIRPYHQTEVSLQSGINVLYGPNGAGKTTILESMCVLATTKSYRASRLFDLTTLGEIAGEISGQTTDLNTLKIELHPRKSIFFKNGDRVTQTSKFLHETKVAVLAPEHSALISGGGERRRDFLDQLLCQRTPTLLDVLKTYRKTLRQKQALLKQDLSFDVYQNQVEPWNQNLVETGEEIRKHRKNLLESLHSIIQAEYERISHTREVLHFPYSQKEESVQEGLSRLTFAEFKIKKVLVGPHRDDFEILLRNQDANQVASQGERASILLALKFAEMTFLTQDQIPIMLLDDIGVTLDDVRCAHLFERLAELETQTLLTTPNPHIMEKARDIGAYILHLKKENFEVFPTGK